MLIAAPACTRNCGGVQGFDVDDPKYGRMMFEDDHRRKGGVHSQGVNKFWDDFAKKNFTKGKPNAGVTAETVKEAFKDLMSRPDVADLISRGEPAIYRFDEPNKHKAKSYLQEMRSKLMDRRLSRIFGPCAGFIKYCGKSKIGKLAKSGGIWSRIALAPIAIGAAANDAVVYGPEYALVEAINPLPVSLPPPTKPRRRLPTSQNRAHPLAGSTGNGWA